MVSEEVLRKKIELERTKLAQEKQLTTLLEERRKLKTERAELRKRRTPIATKTFVRGIKTIGRGTVQAGGAFLTFAAKRQKEEQAFKKRVVKVKKKRVAKVSGIKKGIKKREQKVSPRFANESITNTGFDIPFIDIP